MLKNQKNKFSMYNGVAAHLEKNSLIYSENEEFGNHKSSFNSIAAEIGSKEDERNKATTGKTKDKIINRQAVSSLALGIAGAVYAYAKKNEMITLMETTRITKSRLELLRDDVLVIELNSIKEKAIENAEAIVNYGVPAERLTKFVNSITQYTKALGARASGGSQKTGATKSLTTLFKEADSMLDSIDRLMENYRDTHKEFYDGYKASRVIKNLGIRHNPEVETVNPEIPEQVTGEGS